MRRLLLFVFLIMFLSIGILPTYAQCAVIGGAAPDQIYDCSGPTGVNVGDGVDRVNVTGEVTGTLESSSGTLIVILVGPNGRLNALGANAIRAGGDVSSSGNIAADQHGIYIVSNGNVTSAGDIIAGWSAVFILGSGDISSIGDIAAGQFGIIILGSGDVSSVGDITAGQYGIWTSSGNVSSTGNITAHYHGISSFNGDVTSRGDINAGWSGVVVQSGNVSSTGRITAVQDGIHVGGSGDVTSDGDIIAGAQGIVVGGDGVITVTGSIDAGDIGIEGGAGDQLVVINAVVSGSSGTAIATGGGADHVHLGAAADIRGDILLGSGNDIVQILRGARVDGVIDGGDEDTEDVLMIGAGSYCREASGSTQLVDEARQVVERISPDGATFSFGGNQYTIADFERAVAGERLIYCVGSIDDGRINRYDLDAWVAGYCNLEEGVNLWAIAEDGSGQLDVSVSGAVMRAALEQAVTGGANVQVAAGPRGASLWALASNEYQFMGPDVHQPGQNYVYIFQPGTCGMSNRLDG